MTAIPAPPLLNPTTADLLARLSRLMDGRRVAQSIAMSPETWERLKAEPGQVHCIETPEGQLSFHGVPVRLYEGALGVGIAYDQR